MGSRSPMRRGNFGERVARCKTSGLSAVSCAETSEPIDLPFGLWTRVGRRKHKFNHIRQVGPRCPHGRAHWRHLAAMRQRCGLISNYFDHLSRICAVAQYAVLEANSQWDRRTFAFCRSQTLGPIWMSLQIYHYVPRESMSKT